MYKGTTKRFLVNIDGYFFKFTIYILHHFEGLFGVTNGL